MAEAAEAFLDYKGDTDREIVVPGYISRGREPNGKLIVDPAQVRLAVGPAKRVGAAGLISCLMPTKGRFEQAKLAIAGYRAQTWPHRELIVVDQNLDDRLATWIAGLNDPTIRHFAMPGLAEPLGAIRNRSMDLASGVLICVWDDDDLQHPARLEIGVAAMVAANAAACVLVREMVWMPARQRVGLRPLWPYCNTLLARRDAGLRYPALHRGEDAPAVHGLLGRRRSVLLDLPELYLYVVHGRNTWDEASMERSWLQASGRSEGVESEARLAQLARAYPIAEYAAILEARDAALAGH